MESQFPSVTISAQPARSMSGTSRWLLVAVAFCGALAGGSIVEACAALALHPSTPLSPGHLIAEPLALAGAVCGGVLAVIMARRNQHNAADQNRDMADHVTDNMTDVVEPVGGIPTEPMAWMPSPFVLPGTQPLVPSPARPTRSTRPTIHHHRAQRLLRRSHCAVPPTMSRPHPWD